MSRPAVTLMPPRQVGASTDGGVDIYLSVDHRVIDGGPAARAIRALEAALNGPVLNEVQALASQQVQCRMAAKSVR